MHSWITQSKTTESVFLMDNTPSYSWGLKLIAAKLGGSTVVLNTPVTGLGATELWVPSSFLDDHGKPSKDVDAYWMHVVRQFRKWETKLQLTIEDLDPRPKATLELRGHSASSGERIMWQVCQARTQRLDPHNSDQCRAVATVARELWQRCRNLAPPQ